MRIGLDLDNTLADYSAPLGRLCREYGVHAAGGDPKLALRGFLRAGGREQEWTVLQGELYGPSMREARPFPGSLEFIAAVSQAHAVCMVVSHRTQRPIAGQRHDLHAAARAWLCAKGFGGLPVHFEETKEAKLARIATLGLDVFVDDLPELLLDPAFPCGVRRFLFDPKCEHAPAQGLERVESWDALTDAVLK